MIYFSCLDNRSIIVQLVLLHRSHSPNPNTFPRSPSPDFVPGRKALQKDSVHTRHLCIAVPTLHSFTKIGSQSSYHRRASSESYLESPFLYSILILLKFRTYLHRPSSRGALVTGKYFAQLQKARRKPRMVYTGKHVYLLYRPSHRIDV